MASLNPYLHFNGNAEEAFEFYKSVFGTEYKRPLVRYKDAPSEFPWDESEKEKLMNVSLNIGSGTILLGSDVPASMGKVAGNNFFIYTNAGSREEADKLFSGLSAGGQVLLPIADTFWGSYFGMLRDKFDIGWMISFEHSLQQ
ncbi:MAG TPA: VOC family protein [Segetibacter sp.]|jgi:PhnB protein